MGEGPNHKSQPYLTILVTYFKLVYICHSALWTLVS